MSYKHMKEKEGNESRWKQCSQYFVFILKKYVEFVDFQTHMWKDKFKTRHWLINSGTFFKYDKNRWHFISNNSQTNIF